MLTCKQITELVTDYLGGQLGLADRMRCQTHLGMCKHCRAYRRQMKTTIETLGCLPDDPIPDDDSDAPGCCTWSEIRGEPWIRVARPSTGTRYQTRWDDTAAGS